jgi:hypothetical protein
LTSSKDSVLASLTSTSPSKPSHTCSSQTLANGSASPADELIVAGSGYLQLLERMTFKASLEKLDPFCQEVSYTWSLITQMLRLLLTRSPVYRN